MGTSPELIPGESLQKVYEHFLATGEPLLRENSAEDSLTIIAWPGCDGTYDLAIDGEDAELACLESWQDMAEYLGVDFEELRRQLLENGYPPEHVPEDVDDEEVSALDPYYVLEFLPELPRADDRYHPERHSGRVPVGYDHVLSRISAYGHGRLGLARTLRRLLRRDRVGGGPSGLS